MIALALIALVAFSCEALAGFGGTALALALGAHLLPLPELLAILVPANLTLSLGMVARHRAAVDLRLLALRIAPAMLAGLPLGLALDRLAGRALVPLYALVVVGLAVVSWLEPRGRDSRLWLWLAGVVHGAYGTGGPLVVFVAGRQLDDKHAIRATLAALWLAMNAILLFVYCLEGRVDGATLRASLLLVPVAAGALVAGEAVAARIAARPFRSFGAALLGVAGILLLVRGA